MYCDPDCECRAPRFPASDEALADLRRRLSGDEPLEAMPVDLTVFTLAGDKTVTVREDSIEYKVGGQLIAEGVTDKETMNDLYTFMGVIGYRTRPV